MKHSKLPFLIIVDHSHMEKFDLKLNDLQYSSFGTPLFSSSLLQLRSDRFSPFNLRTVKTFNYWTINGHLVFMTTGLNKLICINAIYKICQIFVGNFSYCSQVYWQFRY